MSAVIEFAVRMKGDSCVNAIREKLRNIPEVESVEFSLEKGAVVVQTNLPSSVVQQHIESTGRQAVVKGYGSSLTCEKSEKPQWSSAAVAMLGGPVGFSRDPRVKGVVRFVQADPDTCIIDGTVDGLTPGLHGLHIHECGDLSQGCDSVGDHFDLNSARHGSPEDDANNRHTGDLGNIHAQDNGRAVFRFADRLVKVSDLIGRSVVVTEGPDDMGRGDDRTTTTTTTTGGSSAVDGNSGGRLACGVISRSAGLFENAKKICDCDGVTLWDERNVPVAGHSRRRAAVEERMDGENTDKTCCSCCS